MKEEDIKRLRASHEVFIIVSPYDMHIIKRVEGEFKIIDSELKTKK